MHFTWRAVGSSQGCPQFTSAYRPAQGDSHHVWGTRFLGLLHLKLSGFRRHELFSEFWSPEV